MMQAHGKVACSEALRPGCGATGSQRDDHPIGGGRSIPGTGMQRGPGLCPTPWMSGWVREGFGPNPWVAHAADIHRPDRPRSVESWPMCPPCLDAPTPLGFAHRGGAGAGGENTVAAFARAVSLGYRYIETDVRATADGVAVIVHDETLDRVFGRPGRVRDMRWVDLASVRVDGATVVPRLAEVLDGWPEVRFNIDAKSDDAVAPIVAAVRWAAARHD